MVEKLYTLSQAAEYYRVHVNTVVRWTRDGLLKCYRVGPRRDRRFRECDLAKLLEQPKKRDA